MDFLLDTHTLIWFLNGDGQLSEKARILIEDSKGKKYISIASLWEISIKIGLGKLEFEGDTKEIVKLIELNGFEVLPILIEHTVQYKELELIHRDPFDRMIITQAIVDEMTIVSRDENIHQYKVQVVW